MPLTLSYLVLIDTAQHLVCGRSDENKQTNKQTNKKTPACYYVVVPPGLINKLTTHHNGVKRCERNVKHPIEKQKESVLNPSMRLMGLPCQLLTWLQACRATVFF